MAWSGAPALQRMAKADIEKMLSLYDAKCWGWYRSLPAVIRGYHAGKTQAQVAAEVGISTHRVSTLTYKFIHRCYHPDRWALLSDQSQKALKPVAEHEALLLQATITKVSN